MSLPPDLAIWRALLRASLADDRAPWPIGQRDQLLEALERGGELRVIDFAGEPALEVVLGDPFGSVPIRDVAAVVDRLAAFGDLRVELDDLTARELAARWTVGMTVMPGAGAAADALAAAVRDDLAGAPVTAAIVSHLGRPALEVTIGGRKLFTVPLGVLGTATGETP